MRPEGWDNPNKLEAHSASWDVREAFEAGADAYESLLKKGGVFTYGHHTPDIELEDAKEVSGYWCFIPEVKE